MEEIELCQTIGANTLNNSYHRREALVIGMRRLITEAINKNLLKITVLNSPGVPATLYSTEPSKSGDRGITLFSTEDE
jgi:hypothetical protein